MKAGQFDENLLTALREARRVLLLTGAGVSAESGVPTFRDRLTGLWERSDPAELATPEAFRRDPALVWGWYEWRRMRVMRARPNPAHLAIADIAARVPAMTLVTQNVDDLHERAGQQRLEHFDRVGGRELFEQVGQVRGGIKAICASAADQGKEVCARAGTEWIVREEPHSATLGHHGVILPISGKKLKFTTVGIRSTANRAELMAGVRSHLRRRQKQPQVIRNLFQEKHVRYAT